MTVNTLDRFLVIEADDDDGHVVTAALAESFQRPRAARVEDFLTHLGQDDGLGHAGAVTIVALFLDPTSDRRDHLVVGHGIPHAVSGQDEELPLLVELERLNLRHCTDDLLPRRLVDFALEQEVAKASRWDQHTANPETVAVIVTVPCTVNSFHS